MGFSESLSKALSGYNGSVANALSKYNTSVVNAGFGANIASVDSIVDGDTIAGARLLGFDTAESTADVDSNTKAKKLESEYGLKLADQKRLGLSGKHKLEEFIKNNPNTQFVGKGFDVYGRPLLENKALTEYMLSTGLAAPTANPTAKEMQVFQAAQQKLRNIDPKTADFMEGTRLYNTQHIKTSVVDDAINVAKAGISGILGVAESVLEAPSKLYKTLGGDYMEEGSNFQKIMPNYSKAVKYTMDTMKYGAELIKEADRTLIGYNSDKQDRLKYHVGKAFDENNYVTGVLGALVSNPLGAAELATQMYGFSKAMSAKGLTGLPVIAGSFTDNADQAHSIFVKEYGREPNATETGWMMALAAAGTAMDTGASKVLYGGGKAGKAFSSAVSSSVKDIIAKVPNIVARAALGGSTKVASIMGVEGLQEGFTEATTVLGGTQDIDKAAKDEYAKQVFNATALGAISGPGMSAINAGQGVATGINNYLENRKSKSNVYTKEQRVEESKTARDVMNSIGMGIKDSTISLQQALKTLNELDTDALAKNEKEGASKLKEWLIQNIAKKETVDTTTYGSQEEAILDIENIANSAKSIQEGTPAYQAIQNVAISANISPELLAKTLKTYESVESEATTENRGYITTGLKLRTEQAKGEAANPEKLAKYTNQLDKFYQSTNSTYNRLKSGFDTLMKSEGLRTVTVGDYTIHKSKSGIEAYKKVMEAKERTMKGILAEGKKANVQLDSKPKVNSPYIVSKEGKHIDIGTKGLDTASTIIAPKTSNVAIANPVMMTNEDTEFIKNQVVGISVPRYKEATHTKNVKEFNGEGKISVDSTTAPIKKMIDKAIEAGAKFTLHSYKGMDKVLKSAVVKHLQTNGYVYAGKSGEWVKAEVLHKNDKPKKEKEVKEEEKEEDTAPKKALVTNKTMLSTSSSKGMKPIGKATEELQAVDINDIVQSTSEATMNTKVLIDKESKSSSVETSWYKALNKVLPKMFTSEMLPKATKLESVVKFKAKDDLARGILFLQDGVVNSKALTAMALAANEYLVANGSTMAYMDDDTAKKILGNEKATRAQIKQIKELGVPGVVVANALGNSVINYMGLSIKDNVPAELGAKLKAAIGQQTLMLMEELHLVKPTVVQAGKVGSLLGTETTNPKAQVYFYSIDKKVYSATATKAREIFNKMQEELGTKSTVVTGPTEVMPKMKEYTKTTARRNKVTIVPDKAIKALNKLIAEKHYPVASAVEWVKSNEEQAKILMGYKTNINGELDKLSRRERESIEAANIAIEKEVQSTIDIDTSKGVFFDWFFSRNGRFMQDSNTINTQSGKKLHRWIYVGDNNTSIVEKGKEKDEYYIALAQAVGYGIDKYRLEKSVEMGKKIVELGYDKMSTMLKGAHIEGMEVEHLGQFLGMLDTLQKMEKAKEGNKVKVQLLMEFDAKTSGFGIKIGQLGFDNGYQQKVGVYVGDRADVTNISDQLDPIDPTMKVFDVYEGSAVEMDTSKMNVEKTSIGIWNELRKKIPSVVKGEKVSSELRTLFKQPFMEFNYAAGLKTLIKSFSTKIVEDILNDIAVNNGKGSMKLLEEIQAVTGLKNVASMLREKYSEDITYKVGNKKGNLQTLLTDLVTNTYGAQLEEHYKKEYKELIDANQVMNNAFVGMFAAYRAEYNKRVKGIKGITAKQKLEIIKELQNVFPLIRGPLSKDINEGIPIYSYTRSHTDGEYGATQVSFLNKDGTSSQRTAQAIVREFEEATKAGAVVPIHYIDGATMANTINNSNKGLLGVHDAAVVSIDSAKDTTQNYNREWYTMQSSYSVIEAVAEAVSRVVDTAEGAEDLNVKVQLLQGMSDNSITEDGEYNVSMKDLKQMTNKYAMKVSANRQQFFNQPMTVVHMAGPKGSAYQTDSVDIPVYNPRVVKDYVYSVKKVSKDTVESQEVKAELDNVAEEYGVSEAAEILTGELSPIAKALIEGCE